MHEFTAAQHILSIVLDIAAQHKAKKVTEIAIEIRVLSHLNQDQLIFCLKTVAEKTIAQDAKIMITEKDIEIACRNCKYQGSPQINSTDPFTVLGMIACPKCNNRDIEVRGQTDCIVQYIRVKK